MHEVNVIDVNNLIQRGAACIVSDMTVAGNVSLPRHSRENVYGTILARARHNTSFLRDPTNSRRHSTKDQWIDEELSKSQSSPPSNGLSRPRTKSLNFTLRQLFRHVENLSRIYPDRPSRGSSESLNVTLFSFSLSVPIHLSLSFLLYLSSRVCHCFSSS